MKNKLFRQGDVLVERIRRMHLDTAAIKVERESGRIILAHGEATGHAHAIAEAGVEMFDIDGQRLVVSDTGFSIQHEEHGRIDLPAGMYRVTRQREYAPENIRNVLD